jgi:hypothetical protein
MEIDPDRQIIEGKDRDVVKKFRAVAAGKEKKKRKKSRERIGALLIVCCIGLLLVLKNVSWQRLPVTAMAVKQSKDISKTDSQPPLLKTETGFQIFKQAELPAVDLKKKDPSPVISSKDIASKIKIPRYAKDKKEIENSGLLIVAEKKVASGSLNSKSKPGAIQIAKILTCRSVDDRRHISPQKVFSVKKDSHVFVWMDVQSKKLPCTLTHVYFVNGRRYCVIPLTIGYSRMRTWSNISLDGYNDEGKWRVDVVTDKGETIAKAEFAVIP